MTLFYCGRLKYYTSLNGIYILEFWCSDKGVSNPIFYTFKITSFSRRNIPFFLETYKITVSRHFLHIVCILLHYQRINYKKTAVTFRKNVGLNSILWCFEVIKVSFNWILSGEIALFPWCAILLQTLPISCFPPNYLTGTTVFSKKFTIFYKILKFYGFLEYRTVNC